jgi:GNAT superfamily N-acetyltransferase
VAPARRGDGIGESLVNAAVDEARRGGLDYVSVHPSERSVPLYRRVGFRGNARTLEIDLRTGRG